METHNVSAGRGEEGPVGLGAPTGQPCTAPESVTFTLVDFDLEQLVVAFLVHRIKSLPPGLLVNFASAIAGLATCKTQDQFVKLVETARRIIFHGQEVG